MTTPFPPELVATISDLKEAVVHFDERTKYLGEQIGRLDGSLNDLRQDVKEQINGLKMAKKASGH